MIPAMISARSFLIFCPGLIALLLATAAPADLSAQAIPPTAHVRFWKTDLHDLNGVRVSLKSASGRRAAPRELGGGGPGYLFGNYQDAPTGHGTLEIYAGANKLPLLTLPTTLNPGEFLTVFLSEPSQPGGPPRLELIEDAPTTADIASAQLIVRNFVFGLKDVRVKVGESLNAQVASGDGVLQLRGLKPLVYPIYTTGIASDGKPFEWNTDVDLKQHRHQTLLIYPDPYGRIRPRLSVDGEGLSESPADKGDQR